MFPRPPLIGICFILFTLNQSSDHPTTQEKWVMLAEAFKQDHIFLSTAENPMSTCLVVVPFKPEDYPESLKEHKKKSK